MKKVMNSKSVLSILSLVLIVAMAFSFSACGNDGNTDNAGTTDGSSKSFVFKVVDLDGTEKSFDIETEADTVGQALVDENLISGTDSEYGLMVDTVNGVKYDYNEDGAYWAFYVNDEYAQTGVDATDIVDGTTYSFVATKA